MRDLWKRRILGRSKKLKALSQKELVEKDIGLINDYNDHCINIKNEIILSEEEETLQTQSAVEKESLEFQNRAKNKDDANTTLFNHAEISFREMHKMRDFLNSDFDGSKWILKN